MQIKTKLKLVGISPIIFALLIGCAFWSASIDLERMQTQYEYAEDLRITNFELNILSQELVLYGGDRVKNQLQVQYAEMGTLLAKPVLAKHGLIESVRRDYQSQGTLLNLLQASDHAGSTHIAGTLLVKFQDVAAKLHQLEEEIAEQRATLEQRRNKGVLILLAALAAINAAALIQLGRHLIKGITTLSSGMEIIQSGNLGHQIPLDSNDELATLTRGFNSMNSSLYESVLSLNNEITERKKAAQQLQRLNRELLAISSCNQTLMRADDEQALLNAICSIVCTEAGYRMAWVGYTENNITQTIRPVAWFNAGALPQSGFPWADSAPQDVPSGRAIRDAQIVCVQDFAALDQDTSWLDSTLQLGYRSGIALPLKDEQGGVFGVLNIYSGEVDAFNPEELRLLDELAGDLAFGITVLRARIVRRQLEEDLNQLNKELEQRVLDEVEKNQAKDHIMAHQARLAAMGEMLSNIAHQWRQPLNNVSVLIQSLQVDYDDDLLTSDSCHQYVQECMQYLTYMSRTIDRFRSLYQPDYDRQRFSLCHLVTETIDLVRDELEYSGITISLATACNATVNGYKKEFSQVLLNIIQNAREVLLSQHREEPRLELACRQGDRTVQLLIRDNGGGIAPEMLDKIFDPYFTSKFKARGVGMGLYISKMIIEKHMGGSITVANIAGGAEVLVELPLDQ